MGMGEVQMKRSFKAALCASFMAAGAAAPQAAELVNAGFETGNLNGWSSSGNVYIFPCEPTVFGCAPSGGNYATLLAPDTLSPSAAINQTITGSNSGPFEFGAWISLGTTQPQGNFNQAQINLQVQGAGVNQTIGLDPNAIQGQFTILGGAGMYFTPWFQLSGLLNFVGSGDLFINISAQNYNGTPFQMWVDNAYITAVPVPAGLVMMGTALAGLGALRRRSKAA
jgi:hypothetical protein